MINEEGLQRGSLFSIGDDMKLKVYMHIVNERIECICLQVNKGCDGQCIKDTVTYDQYQDLIDCIKNRGNKNYKGAR